MQHPVKASERRILLIDDSPAIHADFRKVLPCTPKDTIDLEDVETAVFGDTLTTVPARRPFQIDSAFQGQQGVELVLRSLQERHPYALAFVDVRMPPGLDGIETVKRIWELDPDIQIVLCTAHSDYSWEQTLELLGHADRFLVLKKPFDPIEVKQLAEGLTAKCRLVRLEKRHLQEQRVQFGDLERRLNERNSDLRAARSINAQLDAANRRLTADKEGSDPQLRQRCSMERDLRRALLAGELRVWYQPLFEIATQRIVGLEALARWERVGGQMTSPAEFIPVAEATGLIVPLGEFVLRTVCEQVVQWQHEQVPVVRVAVNWSPVQLEQQPVHELVRRVLHETGMQPHQLALELTESALLPQHQSGCLQELRNSGVEIEVDDFGTGYSTLANLKQLPIDALKIDRSLIEQVDSSASDEAIIVAILTLARTLRLRVVAEGVERVTQLQVLGRHGCEYAQGFYFSHPLPPSACRELLLEVGQHQSLSDTLRLRIAARGERS
jgi:EAL domain-containing protein (putative c-di-GMP-specific phosphodiesterase class I)/ActR/RegA family two-component response regulator